MNESSKSIFVLLSLLFRLFVICSGGKERMTPWFELWKVARRQLDSPVANIVPRWQNWWVWKYVCLSSCSASLLTSCLISIHSKLSLFVFNSFCSSTRLGPAQVYILISSPCVLEPCSHCWTANSAFIAISTTSSIHKWHLPHIQLNQITIETTILPQSKETVPLQ